MTLVPLIELAPGTAFKAPWRKEGRHVGEVVYHGSGSTTVRMPHLEDSGYETLPVSQDTMVMPVERAAFNVQQVSNYQKSKSRADSPVETVWEICDKLKNAIGKALTKKETKEGAWLELRTKAIEEAIKVGVNRNTAKTQYYAWRKKNLK